MDILLNLKVEEAINERGRGGHKEKYDSYINSSRGGHGPMSNDCMPESERSSNMSQISQREGPPQVYEEMIQTLEADVRKHIRIE